MLLFLGGVVSLDDVHFVLEDALNEDTKLDGVFKEGSQILTILNDKPVQVLEADLP